MRLLLSIFLLVPAALGAQGTASSGDPAAVPVCLALGAGEAALAPCREAVRQRPADAAVRARLAEALLATADSAGAERAWREAVRLAPDSAAPHFGLARLLDARRQRRLALHHYGEFARLTPDDGAGLEIVGWMHLELHQAAAALAAFREAGRRPVAASGAHYGAGLALEQLGRREEAIRALQAAVAAAPSHAEAWGAMARVAARIDRHRDAVAWWERAVAVDAGYFDLRRDERRQWERLVRRVGQQPPAPLTAVAAAPVAHDAPAGGVPVPAVESIPPRPVPPMADPTPRARRSSVFAATGSTGSGFIITSQGHVLTNRHVVRSCTAVRVRPEGGALMPARLVALDTDDDLALLKVDTSFATAAVFRAGRDPRAGEDVVAVGFPLNGLLADQVHVSAGTVNALAGMYNDAHELQMSAPVQPGNSGGPLLDASGHVVGIVVTKLNARVVADATGDLPQNVNFAIKAGVAREFLTTQGVAVAEAASTIVRPGADIGETGRAVTVLVECMRDNARK